MSEEIKSALKARVFKWHKEKREMLDRAKKASLLNKAAYIESAAELQHNIEAGLLALVGAGEHGERNK